MNDHLIQCPANNGYNTILEIGDKDMDLTGFGLLNLTADQTWETQTQNTEAVLVILGGKCEIQAGSQNLGQLGQREDVFSGKPYTVYLPPDCDCKITGVTDVKIAIALSPCDQAGKPAVVTPDQCKVMSLGTDNHLRDAVVMIGDDFPSRHFFVGEAWVPSGNWASYPPHRHDFDNPPDELNMQEIYFFRFNPQHGYGLQQVYTDDRSTDARYVVQNNDTVAIPEGYHPVVNAPGYTMYYLWVMTGDSRGFVRFLDPVHAGSVG